VLVVHSRALSTPAGAVQSLELGFSHLQRSLAPHRATFCGFFAEIGNKRLSFAFAQFNAALQRFGLKLNLGASLPPCARIME
jgi:hypothetical protein